MKDFSEFTQTDKWEDDNPVLIVLSKMARETLIKSGITLEMLEQIKLPSMSIGDYWMICDVAKIIEKRLSGFPSTWVDFSELLKRTNPVCSDILPGFNVANLFKKVLFIGD